MIIRRKHTSKFTTIGNILFNDERLQADEVGIIGYLLSRPDDWQVRRPALARRFKYGRDAIKRVMWNAMRTGWIVARKSQLSDGRIFTLYEIRDEPGPTLSDDEIRAALSLGSSEVETDSDTEGEERREDGEVNSPAPCKPALADPALADSSVAIYKDSLSTESTKYSPTQKGGCAFSDVKAKWPIEHVLSPVVCERLHLELSESDQIAVLRAVEPYLADCKKLTRKVCDLATFYRERRFEKFAGRADAALLHVCRRGTAQAFRWGEYYRRTDPAKFETFERWMANRGQYTTPSEWPPGLPQKAAGEAVG